MQLDCSLVKVSRICFLSKFLVEESFGTCVKQSCVYIHVHCSFFISFSVVSDMSKQIPFLFRCCRCCFRLIIDLSGCIEAQQD